MPRPRRDRVLISLYMGRSDVATLDRIAAETSTTRSEVTRLATSHGLASAEADLKARPANR